MSARALAAAGVVTAIGLAATPTADAKVFCAGSPAGVACEESHPATGAGLQAAIDAADAYVDIGGSGDTVQIDAGFYDDPDGFRTEGGNLQVIGRGPADTVLRATDAGNPNKTVLRLKAGSTTAATALRGVRAEQLGTSSGAIREVMNVADVQVIGGTIGGLPPVLIPPGGRLSRAVVAPDGLQSTLSGVFIEGGVVEDTLIRVRPATSPGTVRGISVTGAPTIRHVTVIGDGTAATEGLLVSGVNADAAAQVRDSVFVNVGVPLRRFQTGTGSATITYRYTWLDPAKPFMTQGTGAITAGPGNPAGDPRLNSEGIPQAGSVLIDRGDPAAPGAGDSATDVRGGARIQNGRRDIGAYETRPGTAAPLGGGNAADRTAPRITKLKLKRRKGTLRISFRLSEAARVKFTFERKGRKKRRTVYRRKGSFTKARTAGANTIVFKGKIGRKRLPRGRYRLTLVATDKARNRSRPARARLRTLFPPGK